MWTIVRDGEDWRRMCAAGKDLNKFFAVIQKTNAGDGVISKNSSLGHELMSSFDLPAKVRLYCLEYSTAA